MKVGGGNRKERSDKKVPVKPTVSLELKRHVYTFAHLCNEPVKVVAERLIIEGAMSKFIIDEACKWFRRDYNYNNVVAVGHPEKPRLKIKYFGETGPISMKLPREDYDILCDLAYALDITPTTTAGMLIKLTMNNARFMREYVPTFLRHLDSNRIRLIESLLKQIWEKERGRR